MDASFELEFSLQRFLARCPALRDIQKFDNLLKKGEAVTEDELVSSVAELFLHPKYTIPLVGCFRPIVKKIVDKSVALLRFEEGKLSANLDESALGYLDDEKVVDVIDFHIQQGIGLNLHELACLAFCRALDLAPFLLRSILTYFEFAPPPFIRFLGKGMDFKLSVEVLNHYLHAVQTSYRFLLLELEVFSKLWNWSCFLDLIRKTIQVDLRGAKELEKHIADIKWCEMHILSAVLQMSDRATSDSCLMPEEAFSCLLRWEEFCMDVAIEKAGAYAGSLEHIKLHSANGDLDFHQDKDLPSFDLSNFLSPEIYVTEPPMKKQRISERDDESIRNSFVMTNTLRRSFEMVLLAVRQKWPVLLYGPAGSGKSALINKIANACGNQVLSIYMDDQLDGKTLVGTYVCTEQPGEFRWQPGSLTQAILNGFWVVFEDIDRAPPDVLSTLLPLLEGSSSFATGYGEEIRVADSFRLFSTVSTSSSEASVEGRSLCGALWRKVMVKAPSKQDLQDIIKSWYPCLADRASKLIETFEMVNHASLNQFGGISSGNSASLSSLCRFSLRDLLKWCKRIADLENNSLLNDSTIYQEAVDVFASFSTSTENRLSLMKKIAKMCGVPVSRADTLYPHNKPVIQDSMFEIKIGRVTLQHTKATLLGKKKDFVKIRSSLHVLERIACSVKHKEPVLLVGETGTGKTTLVQQLAIMLGQKLTVLNLSQQSDVADLLGGFKPMDPQSIFTPLYNEFKDLISQTFSAKNQKFFNHLEELLRCPREKREHMGNKYWVCLLNALEVKGVNKFKQELKKERSGPAAKRKKSFDEEKKIRAWESFSARLETARRQIVSSGMMFSFVEGAFITALKDGHWILLDEVNLAPPEIMQRVLGVLDGENGSLCLAEKGDAENIKRHPNFRVFACMNPATDAGKRDLPSAVRSRFSEYFVDDILDDDDLNQFIKKILHLEDSRSNDIKVEEIRLFYKAAKKDAEERLQDGANQKPQYSLRSLYRALEYTREAWRPFGFYKALYDGLCMFFLTLLDGPSSEIMRKKILHLLKNIENRQAELDGQTNLDGYKKEKKSEPIEPSPKHFSEYLPVAKTKDSVQDDILKNYVLTESIKKHLSNLARAVFIKKYPVLLQGPTSSGKTSLVQYLAAFIGRKFVRINNHEHTDLQEYLGSYITDDSGKLVFREGVLVEAVRKGYWIVLDELNLAPSDVLEALNRLLDDNRELFLPEYSEPIEVHKDFMLFATQNPPTVYGGRKMLSRAFRNRFVEIHVDVIPEDELIKILHERCQIPESYAQRMVHIMKELQLHRQKSKAFAGKHGFITPRDLFRWANRFREDGKSQEDLARHGYHLLAERLRDEDEKVVVQEVLERHLQAKLQKGGFYNKELLGEDFIENFQEDKLSKVILTESMWRLFFLVKQCHKFGEPVLLVGETGGGKTTVCQLLNQYLKQNLHILNCHQYTETSDFLGGFYPLRDRSKLLSEYRDIIEQLKLPNDLACLAKNTCISSDINDAVSTIRDLNVLVNEYKEGHISSPNFTIEDTATLEHMKLELSQLHQQWQKIFEWQDGPLVKAMKAGDLFLVDEISLADDSVLERLNSVLEPERNLLLAENGETVLEKITAHKNFFILATMNPGGDYGKKELSPALRNRFTEIWVPPVTDVNELRSIASERLFNHEPLNIIDPMLKFYEWFNQQLVGRALTVRDLLSWILFVNETQRALGPECAFLHGAFLVVLDGLSLGTGLSKKDGEELRDRSFSFLLEQLRMYNSGTLGPEFSKLEYYGWGDYQAAGEVRNDNAFGIHPFFIEKGSETCEVGGFEFLAPTTKRNSLRMLRAMQLPKPVLLEGSPGVGKTSLIVALGKFSGHKVVRINLSEQTDMMDLLGSDLPVESDEGVKFAWSDGILLQALKEGSWILLDELNLAPQSVLEGLNAILDHRAEVFIPELGRTFHCQSSFRVFACQNPSHQGGGRKGLPKSFLNRFTKVYVDELVEEDYLFICGSLYPSVPRNVLSKLISFNRLLHEETMIHHKFGQDGSPWEFNLRDVIRSLQIMQGSPGKVDDFLNIIYVQRMRTEADRKQVLQLYEQVFGVKPSINPWPRVQLNSNYLIVGSAAIKRNCTQPSKSSSGQLKVLPGIRHNLEAAAHCVQKNWMCILVGPSSCGKTSLVRLLAQLTGNLLNELNLSSASDISDLLGCFEQYNAIRNFRFVVSQVSRFVTEYSSILFECSRDTFLNERKDMIAGWLQFVSEVDSNILSGCPFTNTGNDSSIIKTLEFILVIVEQLRSDLEKGVVNVSWSITDLERTVKIMLKLKDHLKKPRLSKFEWVTGMLIKAIENGEWIVLENANLCNPTVLDRINSLVEPDGTITVNECGNIDGEPVVFRPHSNFRVFLTVNPSFGEVSRAMRNRGVEIFIMEPHWIFDGTEYRREEFELKDVKRFLVLTGIPSSMLVDLMAKAHIYAKIEAVRLNLHITYLELARWVQLFQQLLGSGHQPGWSLQISWEHTYISSLGEAEGRNIVDHANNAYLSMTELYTPDLSLESGLCLPGGWPMPLKLRDITWYTKEFHVKQNCLYLEFLGSQYATSNVENNRAIYSYADSLCQGGCPGTYLSDWKVLHQLMFPEVAKEIIVDSDIKVEFNLDNADKMLTFAANWVIEQATENDFELYLQWFSWFSSHLQPFCNLFENLLTVLQVVREHRIWKCILHCHKELLSLNNVNSVSRAIPILSLELVGLADSSDLSNKYSQLLSVAIHGLGLLRCTFQQRNIETLDTLSDKARFYIPFLASLRALEDDILDKLVDFESSKCDLLISLYSDLLGDHILFWKALVAWQIENMLVTWQSLLKTAGTLKVFFPRAAEHIDVCKNLAEGSLLHFHSERSLLWVHGGHPFPRPPSAKLYSQQQHLLQFCESVWPTERSLWNMEDEFLVDVAASRYPELRLCALEGTCMLSFIVEKYDGDDESASQQMAEITEMLRNRFEHEKCQLLTKLGHNKNSVLEGNTDSCCHVSSEMLCTRSGFSSWMDTLPIFDSSSCFLDMKLLEELSLLVLVDPIELRPGLHGIASSLDSYLNYSMTHLTRPPQSLTPHRKMLWILDAFTSVDAADVKVASFVLEMWFWWHSFLWSNCSISLSNFAFSGSKIPLPNILLGPVKTASIAKILQNTLAIKDFAVQSLTFEVASQSLWQCSSPGVVPHDFLLSASRALFKQIIFAHERSFQTDKFVAIKSILSSGQKNMTKENISLLSSLIVSSSHLRLKSLVQSFIEPLLLRLYIHHPSTELHSSLGFVWLYMGGLRFHLLLSNGILDPTFKYTHKLSNLEEKITSLQLERKVRQECEYLSGTISSRENKRIEETLEKLGLERRRLQRKIVFRPDPSKLKSMRRECDEFLSRIDSLFALAHRIEKLDKESVVEEVCNWQATASCFIDQLTTEYAEYIDMVQPVQVAVYEMKLGLSLVVISALQKKFLGAIQEETMDRVLDSIHSFMRFPSVVIEPFSISDKSKLPMFSSLDVYSTKNFFELNLSLLEKLITCSNKVDGENVSVSSGKAALEHNILLRITHSINMARCIGSDSFKLLDDIFSGFASIWFDMKIKGKNQEDLAAQMYKFKPRAFQIESVMEVDVSALGKLLANDNLMEWNELLSEEECTEKMEEENEPECSEGWNQIQESILIDLVNIHNQLFGCNGSLLNTGSLEVSDADRVQSFMDSYTLGVEMMKGLGGLYSSTLDAKLIQEHLFRLSLEHQKKLISTKSVGKYNFYKDSNAPVMATMVKLLNILRQRVLALLDEFEDHPGLQKVMDIIEMLLAIPLSTPLAKALSGLQFMLNSIQILHENGSKFPLSDQLEPLVALVCSWQKMEFESWPVLLDEVQNQYEMNAAKLWFPLFSVLHHKHSHNQATIQSLEELIQTSSIGEFRRRLQLLFAFLGQITCGRTLGAFSSHLQEENLKVLYNLFGFYVQFLPFIMEHVETHKRKTETELKQIMKLCRWDRFENRLSIENQRKTRQKIKKLIQRYSDLLQEPVMLSLNKEVTQKRSKFISLHSPKLVNDNISDQGIQTLGAILDLTPFCEDRSLWFVNWKKKIDYTLLISPPERMSEICCLDFEGIGDITKQSPHSCLSGWKDVWYVLENICRVTIDCDELWRDETKKAGKKPAFQRLLNLLDSCGLHKHKFEIMEVSNSASWLFLQPSYDAQHILIMDSKHPRQAIDVSSPIESQNPMTGSLDNEWKISNEFYFKSLASMQNFMQTCLERHDDFTSEQVSRSKSYLCHLVVIQQAQRAAAYDLAKHFNRLRQYARALESSYSTCTDLDNGTGTACSFASNQYAIVKCMWQQKQLLDTMTTMLMEESLLLRTVESTHANSCQKIKAGAHRILCLIGEYIPVFKKSKDSLDTYLIGCGHEGTIISLGDLAVPYVVSKQMEHLVLENFQNIKDFEEKLVALSDHGFEETSVMEAILHHFDDEFKKGKLMVEQFKSALIQRTDSGKPSELEANFDEALRGTIGHIVAVLQKLTVGTSSEASPEKITEWESLFNSCLGDLRISELSDELLNIVHLAEKLMNRSGKEIPTLSLRVGASLKYIHSLVDLILSFGSGFLQDFLVLHKTVSLVTHVLANMLASLYEKGLGILSKDSEDGSEDLTQDASGTGMGEGVGKKDVSDQITDEDQLLGANEKTTEENDNSNEAPSKNDEGLEMDQDFDAETYSVSEDSGDDDDNDDNAEEEPLDTAMGKTGDDSEVVDEKSWDKEGDEDPKDTKEKYESGPSVKDNNESERELRGKEESAAASKESEEMDSDKTENGDVADEADLGDTEEGEDMNLDKEDEHADPTGLKPEELNQNASGDEETDEKLDMDCEEVQEEPAEDVNNDVDDAKPSDEIMEDAEIENQDGTSEMEQKADDDLGGDHEENVEKDQMENGKDPSMPGVSELKYDQIPAADAAEQSTSGSKASFPRNAGVEENWTNGSEVSNDLVPLENVPNPNNSDLNMMVGDASNDGKFTDDLPKSQLPQPEASSYQKSQANPYRSVGDALKEWKEKVNVSVDLPADNKDLPGEMEDDNANEYGFVSELEKGADQALGPATTEQIDANVSGNEPDDANPAANRDDVTKMEIEEQNAEEYTTKNFASNTKRKAEEETDVSMTPGDEPLEVPSLNGDDPAGPSDCMVSVKRSYFSDDVSQLNQLSIHDEDMGKARDLEEVSGDLKNSANFLWRKYELQTTRLSQELSEQLRLVMAPTLASKLQGDYKTGKRINMKKVIPYIASHYRKDKIWLRRTKPNKRDYQVVIAVDDSHSMLESGCGDVAIKSLVTVCRAMSQLEVGNLAVTSFGKKGNIRLLHDFDQPFTGESGVKMISSLTFKQENTIADEPVVDLMKFLNTKLDTAVTNARLPSGQNPLQQLVLIIGDGRLHEKESLKRCIRDVISSKRMVAFLILDSMQESIMDLQEFEFKGMITTQKRYMDSFPFPYYVVLRNIEALPKTLADLLRQWFELMQNSRD